MRKIRILIPVITLVFICLSCKPSYKEDYCHVTSLDREMIPYQMGDTVRFINGQGELVTLVAVEETRWWEHYEHLYEEYLRVRLRSDTGNYVLFLIVQGWNQGQYHMRELSFGMTGAGGDVLYNSDGNFVSWGYSTAYDSVLIGDHVYYNVVRGFNDYILGGPYQSYYSKTHGVLQMITDGKTMFTLDTVIFASTR